MKLLKVALFSGLMLSMAPSYAADQEEVNLYSARKEQLIKPLLDKFTEQTNIKVNLVTGSADALLKRLSLEGDKSLADLLITTDAGRLYRAKSVDVLQSVDSEVLNKAVPEHLRDPESYWFGLSVRARPIFYVKGKVVPSELSTYEALDDEKWAGRVCIRSSGNIYNQSLVASLIAANGAEKTEAWAEGFVKNFAQPPKGGDRDQIKAAAAGICDIAVANTYYYGGMLTSGDQDQIDAANKVAIFWPNQEDRGTHVNVSGIGMTKAAKNVDQAKQLMEFLVNAESQAWYAEVNSEFPVLEGAKWGDLMKEWGEFKADQLNLSVLGENNADAVKLMDRAGWR
ncbi:Fe(3+) ABC transporter substrate-binding protein [Leucothrix pacifica]|uniref:Fe(3+) ABC transporter substrate-binding protein n=1 Tax=Leucothrix pacifica TaxID=1247513 RepID=A0A317CKQ8_9GAMM|nr:Fe(3+) ABC transporter substrate-binding protein [Leucothrix pacifica]PWQ99086.1 Fe(3+) ABC transporter substrate-binding protein [Leucothrix pacifica]